MKAIERLGITKEEFKATYEETKGFDNEFNKNKPGYSSETNYYNYLKEGADKLIEEHADLIQDLME